MVPLRFEGHRDAAGPLTAGQRNIAKWLRNAPLSPAAVLEHAFAVPAGTTVEDVAACLRVLLCRHEGLRSTYRLDDPGEQRVLAAGSVPLLVRDAADGAGDARRLVALCRAEPFDLAAGPPVRFAVAVAGGQVTAAVMVCSHIAVDFQAIAVLDAEFAGMVGDPAARVPGEPRPQPLDRAELELRPARRRRMDQAVRHWARALRAAPAHPYAKPRTGPPAASGTGSGAYGMSSPAAAMALEHVAARTGASRPAIVLASFCALLSRRTGDATCTFVTLSANRFESDLLRYVGTLAQATFLTVEVGESGFDALVRRCFGAVLQAGLHGTYDVQQQHEQSARIAAERGIAPTFEPMFNSIVMDTRAPAPGPLRDIARAPATETSWVDLPATDILLRFDLGSVDGALIARCWTGDTSRVSPAEAESLLLALERLIIAAAGGDLDHAGIVGALGLPPIERPAGWLHVDHCWVDVAEVQRLLDDALAPAVCRVFAGVGGVPLTAYIAGGPDTAQEAHQRCLAALRGRHAAMAPQRYVLCGQSPADPDLLAGWQAAPVLAEGSGRAGDLALSAV
ncbi:hypothetical protein Daura_34505 [Dactylosporangium aurantiacum]|uniref:Condensation domain-containing protein n=1 Tax=Dactylosporangium aurantiacum TaxID=35754 RepID=A0A9Q9IEM7_9ACTN|nr:condensation domain-containing protein [Dactylosporangium aurantiacum]MDG6107880.1 condensation domain-containing protein [Dactylosporangium aurantiacum]UWZ51808.1 hypothetical protein Daura_34505 [Dactylosporangium aurantiacum]